MSAAGAPLIVTATFGPEDFAWLDGLRRAHFPPERNQLDAHLTLFHHLPPSAAAELVDLLKRLAAGPPPPAVAARPISLGRGVAIGIDSPALGAMRTEIAERFAGLLTPQDRAGWRPHVTVQNKVTADEARVLLDRLRIGFAPRPVRISGLAAWWYRGGPWEMLAERRFRG